MFRSQIKAVMLKIINGTAARTLFHGSQSYLMPLFSEMRIASPFLPLIYTPLKICLERSIE